MQEAFARPWVRWDHVGGYEKIEAWVRRVAINVAIGRWRRVARERPLPEVTAAADDSTGPDIEVLLPLRRIPIHQGCALFLPCAVGLSVGEVGDEISSKLGTVSRG